MVAQVSLSPTPGLYDNSVEVQLSGADAGAVFYTTDGGQPGQSSRRYDGEPIVLNRSATIRVLHIDPDGNHHHLGGTYLIGEPPSELMTVAVGIDPWRLFHPDRGWFQPGPDSANWLTHAEHAARVDVFEADGTPVHGGTMGLRLFGGRSRAFPQKSFSLSGRKKYGNKRIRHPLFGDEAGDSFRFVVLRNGGSDWGRSYLRDALLTGLLQDGSWDLDRQAARPARVYLNGRYWGLYHLRKKINPRFLADRYEGVHKDSIDLLEHQAGVKHGDGRAYAELRSFITDHDLRRREHYARLAELMDVDNFQRLQIAQTYFANQDAGGNIRYWRPRSPEGRFRWILYDVDQGFGLHRQQGWEANTLEQFTDPDGPAWPNPPWSTLFQRKLLANADYRRLFVNRSLDYLHTDFSPEVVVERIDAAASAIAAEMPRQVARWGGGMARWRYHVDHLRRFARRRPAALREHYRDFFAGGPDREVALSAGRGGYVRLNQNIHVGAGGLTGRYFAYYPLELEAVAEPGYRFVGWEGITGDEPKVLQSLAEDRAYTLHATFEAIDHPLADRVIVNEISPRSGTAGDWLEIYNRTDNAVDLTGWYLTDDSHRRFVFPTTLLPAHGYLVICEDTPSFDAAFPTVTDRLGNLPFGLHKRTDRVGLYAADDAYVNALTYDISHPPDMAFTYALALPGLDNRRHRHWVTEAGPGTPGSANPTHLQQALLGRRHYWLRVGFGVSVILLICILRVLKE